MNWDDDEDVFVVSSSTPPPPTHRSKMTHRRTYSSSSDVIVLTDTDDEDNTKSHPAPIRRVLSDAQINLPGPAPGPSAFADPFDPYIARVLEIIPDVETGHLRTLLEEKYAVHGDNVVENVLHVLFEDASYPRVEKVGGKRKRAADDDEGREKSRVKFDYASKDREFTGSHHYTDLALAQLLVDFPYIPKPHIRTTLFANKRLYAPTHLFLAQEALSGRLPYKKKTAASRATGKGRELHDPEFDKERAWLVDHLTQKEKVTTEPDVRDDEHHDDECEDGIECGCCFSTFAFDKMVQCPEAHLFCRSCCRSYAANQLGQHDHRLRCMDQSGCKELFPESELARFLPATLLALYHRLKQQKEIAAAGLEGLEECPFCEYKVVIENPDEKLFRCESADCGVVSCRSCKKVDHLPKSCKEVVEDKHLSVRHAIEEAMTKALMRNCPKCQKGFVKEHGCNKMTCPNCGTLSCYICRQVIVGYEHFGNPPPYTGPHDPNKCNLWDPVEQRHNNEVIVAAKKAIEEYKALHPDVSDETLNVDLPSPVRNPPPAAAAGHMPMHGRMPLPVMPAHHAHQHHVHQQLLQQQHQQRLQQQHQQHLQRMHQQVHEQRMQMQALLARHAAIPVPGFPPALPAPQHNVAWHAPLAVPLPPPPPGAAAPRRRRH